MSSYSNYVYVLELYILLWFLLTFIIFCNMIVQAESLSTTRCYILVATGPCGSLSIRDVLPLELFTCLWLVSPQAPAVERLFSLPSAMVQQFDFIKHFLISTPFSNWCSLCCARSNFCLVQDTKIVTQRPNSRTPFSKSLERNQIVWQLSTWTRVKMWSNYPLTRATC